MNSSGCIGSQLLLLNIKSFFQAITDQFRLSHKDLLCCELQVLILMEFSLMTPINDVLPIYKRLEVALS